MGSLGRHGRSHDLLVGIQTDADRPNRLHLPGLHNAVFLTLYQKPYAASYNFQPLAPGTGALVAVLLTALIFRAGPGLLLRTAVTTSRQLLKPGLTVCLIVALAYLYNYSGNDLHAGRGAGGAWRCFPVLQRVSGLGCMLPDGKRHHRAICYSETCKWPRETRSE